ncbi:hypothetical protein GQ53DRAFT_473905 [Thozetella sp. PMI_491]|nr:hypothetical protein GQ53DRAFT_473905 [Thozetella sp. PMI_491]
MLFSTLCETTCLLHTSKTVRPLLGREARSPRSAAPSSPRCAIYIPASHSLGMIVRRSKQGVLPIAAHRVLNRRLLTQTHCYPTFWPFMQAPRYVCPGVCMTDWGKRGGGNGRERRVGRCKCDWRHGLCYALSRFHDVSCHCLSYAPKQPASHITHCPISCNSTLKHWTRGVTCIPDCSTIIMSPGREGRRRQ